MDTWAHLAPADLTITKSYSYFPTYTWHQVYVFIENMLSTLKVYSAIDSFIKSEHKAYAESLLSASM